MQDLVAQCVEKLSKSNEKAYQEFIAASEEGSAKKGKTLIPIGGVCRKLYVLNSGIIKHFRYKEDGSEHITWFGFKDDMISAYTSFVTQKPSLEGVEVIEDITYTVFPREACYGLAAKYHEMETFFRELLELYYIASDERLFFLQALTAKQKYSYIQKNHPEFIQFLPQKELSSFLGITRETLSRIRKYS
ncbi:Crp/Fnr family transcriptional regulator [Flagellimonas sp. HMM57]|uniref:Crp/Fnr family transcriptional regulator n=1 Tax=unclassified Flagellimonas TaxID=2644544 RepID=UPI0013D08021|nr:MULTISPECIES: Crp/Fnr family transcriptional regulator [unclassified Flagellimonas]UII74788.1 Crp/Fnr family transcriptional regulator [Flagellimonas sp. HMM57]